VSRGSLDPRQFGWMTFGVDASRGVEVVFSILQIGNQSNVKIKVQ